MCRAVIQTEPRPLVNAAAAPVLPTLGLRLAAAVRSECLHSGQSCGIAAASLAECCALRAMAGCCVPSLVTPSELSAASLLTSAWRYEAWLHAYPLNRATVLDYFKHSPFYSLQANNERINAAVAAAQQPSAQPQQQTQRPGQAQGQGPAAEAASAPASSFASLTALRHMEGLEYTLDAPLAAADTAAAAPAASYFVIRKQWRVSPSVAQLLSVYYVVAALEPLAAPSLPVGSVIPMPHLPLARTVRTRQQRGHSRGGHTRPETTAQRPHAATDKTRGDCC